MDLIPREQINILIEIMKINNMDEMSFIISCYTCYLYSYKEHFEFYIMENNEVIEQHKIDRV